MPAAAASPPRVTCPPSVPVRKGRGRRHPGGRLTRRAGGSKVGAVKRAACVLMGGLAIGAIGAVGAVGACDRRGGDPAEVQVRPKRAEAGPRAEQVKALAGRIPDEVEDVLLVRLDLRNEGVTAPLGEAMRLLADALPVTDHMLLHAIANSSNPVFTYDPVLRDVLGAGWYLPFDFAADPRAGAAMLAPLAIAAKGGGCVLDEAARTVAGRQVHGGADDLYGTVCIDERFVLSTFGDLVDPLAARFAEGRLGASAAAALAASVDFADDVRLVSSFASDRPDHPFAFDRALLVARWDAARETTTIELRVRPRPDRERALRRDLETAVAALDGTARRLADLSPISPTADGWLSLRLSIDPALAAALDDGAPNIVLVAPLIQARVDARAAQR